MTQDEIIRMAQDACACSPYQVLNTDPEFLTRFAALIAAHEREKQAKDKQCKHCEDTAACLDAGICLSKYDSTVRIESAVIAAKAEEREACAKVCDSLKEVYCTLPEDCAAAIRARSER